MQDCLLSALVNTAGARSGTEPFGRKFCLFGSLSQHPTESKMNFHFCTFLGSLFLAYQWYYSLSCSVFVTQNSEVPWVLRFSSSSVSSTWTPEQRRSIYSPLLLCKSPYSRHQHENFLTCGGSSPKSSSSSWHGFMLKNWTCSANGIIWPNTYSTLR